QAIWLSTSARDPRASESHLEIFGALADTSGGGVGSPREGFRDRTGSSPRRIQTENCCRKQKTILEHAKKRFRRSGTRGLIEPSRQLTPDRALARSDFSSRPGHPSFRASP